MTKDEALKIFNDLLVAQEPFVFTKFGDTEYLCMLTKEGSGGEHYYSPELADGLKDALQVISSKPNAYLGEWIYSLQEDKGRIDTMLGITPRYVFYDVFLHHLNEYLTPAIKQFYENLKNDPRPKYYIAQEALCDGAFYFLNLNSCFYVPSRDAATSTNIKGVVDYVNQLQGNAIVFTSCSILAKLVIAECYTPEKTFIDLGSALDPLFLGNTRATELDNSQKVRQFYGYE